MNARRNRRIALLAAVGVGLIAVAVLVRCNMSRTQPAVTERPLAGPTIWINKNERTLRLYDGGRCVKTCRIGLGFSPVDHKEREGDGRTPEGRYYVCMKNPQSKFYLSLGVSYPGKADADCGLAAGQISTTQRDAIATAIDAGQCPPWDTPLGGEICIHGRGAGSDWTRGCIALDDADMKDLYEQVGLGTVVVIEP